MMYAGAAVILVSGSFIFLVDNTGLKSLTIVMLVISMAMLLLLCMIMVSSLFRIKQYLNQHLQREFDLKKCIAYALSYVLLLCAFVFYVVNDLCWKLEDSDLTFWLLISLFCCIVQGLYFLILWNLAAP